MTLIRFVMFPTTNDVMKTNAQKSVTNFDINGVPASRCQFPLQNAFALMVHKTQGLTLPHATLTVDHNMFAPGQIYVAMSRASSWKSLDILSFDFDCLKVVDVDVINEYKRLNFLNQK